MTRNFPRLLLIPALAAVAALAIACTGDDATPTPAVVPTDVPTQAPTAAPTATDVPTTTPTAVPTEAPMQTPGATSICEDLHPTIQDSTFVIVDSVTSGQTLNSGDTVTGCSRTFESNVLWWLVAGDGNTIAEGFTMGGGVDGHGNYEFTVEYTVAEAQMGHLFVGGDDPSDGEGFPPPLNQIPMLLVP